MSDKDKTKQGGPNGESTEEKVDPKPPAHGEEDTTQPHAVGHTHRDHDAHAEPEDLNAATTLDDGDDSPMLGFAALVFGGTLVLTVAIAMVTQKDGHQALANNTQAVTVSMAAVAPAPAATTPAPAAAAPAPAAGPPTKEQGEAIFKDPANACSTCHSIDGTRLVGPSLKDKYGSQETLSDGTTVTIDDAYIKESLETPTAKVVKDYAPAMPSMAGKFNETQVASIILYLRHLAGKDPAPGEAGATPAAATPAATPTATPAAAATPAAPTPAPATGSGAGH